MCRRAERVTTQLHRAFSSAKAGDSLVCPFTKLELERKKGANCELKTLPQESEFGLTYKNKLI